MANEHEQNLLRNLAALFKPNAKYADIAIHCRDDAEFRVHRAVVCSLSPVLAGDCEDDEDSDIQYPQFGAEPMRCMLEYCYRQKYVVEGEEELFERKKAGSEVSELGREEDGEGGESVASEKGDAGKSEGSSGGVPATLRRVRAVRIRTLKKGRKIAVVKEGTEGGSSSGTEESEDRPGKGAVGTDQERQDDKGHEKGINSPKRDAQEQAKEGQSQSDDDSNKTEPVDTGLTINKALLAHVEVYKIANHFQIPTLKRLATQRFEHVSSTCGIQIEGFVDVIKAVRAHERESPGDLHHALYTCIAASRVVIAEDKAFWKDLASMSDASAFAAAMFRTAIRSETKRVERHAKKEEQLQDTIREMEKDVRLSNATTAQLEKALHARFIESQAGAHRGLDWGVASDWGWMLLPVSIFAGCAVIIWANWGVK